MIKDEVRFSVMCEISMALKSPKLQQGFEIICKNLSELEKENTELKELDRSYKQLLDKGSTTLMNERLKSYKQLTKAKNLLNEFMRISKAGDEDFEHDYSELIEEAEKFIKEVK